MTQRFQRHAATPGAGGRERILRGVERNRYWVYTSRDIRFLHFFQRRFEIPYTWISSARRQRPVRGDHAGGPGMTLRSAKAAALAALLALAGAGTAQAAPTTQDTRFTASDGVTLQATVTGEAPISPRPTIVEFSPYGRGTARFDAGPAYNYLLVQIRGTGDSDGRFDALGPRTQTDVVEVLEVGLRAAVERRPPRPQRLLGERDRDLQLAPPGAPLRRRPRC